MSSDSYNISIVIIGYNTLSTLANTINSINRLKVSNHNVEVIYIDDGSSNEKTLETMKNIQDNSSADISIISFEEYAL